MHSTNSIQFARNSVTNYTLVLITTTLFAAEVPSSVNLKYTAVQAPLHQCGMCWCWYCCVFETHGRLRIGAEICIVFRTNIYREFQEE
jgi:hypothetical protein